MTSAVLPHPCGRDGVLVVGDVINDVIVRPLGPITTDSDTRAHIVQTPGGSAANVACWLGATGTTVSFVGRVGESDHSFHSDSLSRFGVRAKLAVDTGAATGTIVVIVDEQGHRTMLTDRGANLNLVPDDVPRDVLGSAALLHLSGYSFFEPAVRTTVRELMARAREAGVPVSIDPSSVAFLRDSGIEQFLRWTTGASLAFPNREEAFALAGVDDPLVAARRLTAHYGVVVVTLEGDGAVVARAGEEAVRVRTERIRALDSTGAGDSFCAGFLRAWLHGLDDVAAASAGAALAAVAVSRMGARPPQ